jgi:MFS transporter, DHA3 family, macrolide efflux protein
MPRGIPWRADRWRGRFFTIWTGQAFSLFGSQLVGFALVWWLTEKTGSGVVLTLATMAAVLPQVLLAPFVGALVDRWDRRWTMIAADGSVALTTSALAALFALGLGRVEYVYVALFVRSIGGGFHWPAMQASTTLMVPDKELSRIAGLNQTLGGVMSIAAPAAGAALLALIPLQAILAVDVVTALMAIVPLLVLEIPRVERHAEAMAIPFFHDLAEGFRFVISWRGLLAIAGIAAFVNFALAPAASLLPLLLARRFHGTAAHFAAANMAFGVGVMGGGALLAAWGGFRHRTVTALLAVAAMGATTLAVGLVPFPFFAELAVVVGLTGAAQSIANGSIGAAMQASVPPELQGRVFTLVGAVSGMMQPVGLALAGPLSDKVGIGVWFLVSGGLSLFLGVAGLFVRPIVHLEDEPELGARRS